MYESECRETNTCLCSSKHNTSGTQYISCLFSFTIIQSVFHKCGPPEVAGPQCPVTMLTALVQLNNRGQENISGKHAVVVITQQLTEMLKSAKVKVYNNQN